MSSTQTSPTQSTDDVSIPVDMTREEVITACQRTAQRDNEMSDVATELLEVL